MVCTPPEAFAPLKRAPGASTSSIASWRWVKAETRSAPVAKSVAPLATRHGPPKSPAQTEPTAITAGSEAG